MSSTYRRVNTGHKFDSKEWNIDNRNKGQLEIKPQLLYIELIVSKRSLLCPFYFYFQVQVYINIATSLSYSALSIHQGLHQQRLRLGFDYCNLIIINYSCLFFSAITEKANYFVLSKAITMHIFHDRQCT